MAVNKSNRLVLTMLFISCVVCFVDKTAINFAIIPMKSELNLSSEDIGMIMSAFFLAYAATQALSGYLVDRYGARKILSQGIVIWSAGTVLSAFSAGLTQIVIARFIVGLGEAVFPPGSSVAVAEHFEKSRMAKAKSILTSGASVGFALGALLVPMMIAAFHWRTMFVILGVAGGIVALALWQVLKKAELAHGGRAVAALSTKQDKVSIRAILKKKLTWQIAVCYFFTNIIFWGLQSWLPLYWVNVRGMNMVTMGAWSAVPPVMGFLSFLVSGWLLDRFFSGYEKYLLAIAASGTALFIGLMLSSSSIPLNFAYLTAANIFLNTISITVFVTIMKRFPVKMVGTATGLINSLSQIGSFISPMLLGVVLKWTHQNYTDIFIMLIIFAIIILLSVIGIKNEPLGFALPEQEVPV